MTIGYCVTFSMPQQSQYPGSTVQSALTARSEGLVKSSQVEACCAVRQEENCKRNLHKNFLANLETELLTHSVVLKVRQWTASQYFRIKSIVTATLWISTIINGTNYPQQLPERKPEAGGAWKPPPKPSRADYEYRYRE